MDSKLILLVLCVFSCASAAIVKRHRRDAPSLTDILLGQKVQNAVPVQPIDGLADETADDGSTSAVIEETLAGESTESEESSEESTEKEEGGSGETQQNENEDHDGHEGHDHEEHEHHHEEHDEHEHHQHEEHDHHHEEHDEHHHEEHDHHHHEEHEESGDSAEQEEEEEKKESSGEENDYTDDEPVASALVSDDCADISGIWQSESSTGKLVVIQDEHGHLYGLVRNTSTAGWFDLHGYHGNGAAFAFHVIWQDGNAASSVAGHCHNCDSSIRLELQAVHALLLPECRSKPVTMLSRSFRKIGDAADAKKMHKSVEESDENVSNETEVDANSESSGDE